MMSYSEYKNLDFSFEALVGAVKRALSEFDSTDIELRFDGRNKEACLMFSDGKDNFKISETIDSTKISCEEIGNLYAKYGIRCIPA